MRFPRVLSVVAAACVLRAQAPLTFEVASIKVAKSGVGGVRGGCHGIDSVFTPGEAAEAAPLGRCVIADGRLSHMVGIAWGVEMNMLKTGPDWIQRGDLRFNLEAKAENPTKATEKQVFAMLQALLVERFQMKYHLEPVTLQGFALVVDKKGLKMKKSVSQDTDANFGPHGKPGRDAGMFQGKRISMANLTQMLSGFGDRGPGIDKTGLDGYYDVSLTWNNLDGPTIDTALLEQLGLRMEPQKVQTNYFVIDSAKQPIDN